MTTIVFALKDVNLDLPAVLKQIYEQLAQSMLQDAKRAINQALEQYVDDRLGRAPYVRRKRVRGSDVLRCQRCGSRVRAHFSRNGYRQRGLTLVIGPIQIALPRVRCQCGGSVSLNWPDLRPRQRLGADWQALVQHWSKLTYSLRQIKQEVDAGIGTSVGLRSLNERLHQIAAQLPTWQTRWLDDVPPVVMVDAIWVPIVEPTEQRQRDRLRRQRLVKRGRKLPVMIALGVWPEAERSEVIDFEIGTGPGEDRDSWLRLLNRLEGRGLRPETGLQLFIHDGGAALIAALKELFPEVAHQRCIFHKLRNMLRAIVPPAELSKEERRPYIRDVIRQAALIWQAPTYEEALRRRQRFRRRWEAEQPALVGTLDRDFADTLTFYHIWNRNRLWPMSYLRTTSLLERTNRKVRYRLYRAGAYHSPTGLQAMLAQVLIDL
jgi:transposase-like protein